MLQVQSATSPRSGARPKLGTEPLVPISFNGPQWFAVMTNPQCELRAERELAQRGFRVFLPKLRKWVSHARVRKAVFRPLLPRYLFVEVDHPRQSFGEVKLCNGVETILHNGGVPQVVHRSFVEEFLTRYLAGEWDYVRQEPCRVMGAGWRENPPLPVGARVRVMDGKFDGLLATLTSVRGHKVVAKLLGDTQYVKLLALSVRAA